MNTLSNYKLFGYNKWILYFLLLPFLACTTNDDSSKNNNPILGNCDEVASVNQTLYENANQSQLQIENWEFDENCLLLTYSSSGCDGSSWVIELIGSENIMESDPLQRNVSVNFINNEACLAYITKTTSFELTNLQVEGSTQIILNLEGVEDDIFYEY